MLEAAKFRSEIQIKWLRASVSLKIIDLEGQKSSRDIEFAYMLPECLIPGSQFVDLAEFMDKAALLRIT